MTACEEELPPRLQAALDYAARGIPVLPSHFPVPVGVPPGPAGPPGSAGPGGTPLACSCGSGDCPTPARHPIWTVAADDATTNLAELVRWWIGMPEANVATPAGVGFGMVELCHHAPAELIVGWLAMQGIRTGPLIAAGPTCHQFLVAPGTGGWSFRMTAPGSVLRLGLGGGLILLPPSRLVDGAVGGWLRPLGAAPPDGGLLYRALLGIPGSVELAGSVPRGAAQVLEPSADAPT